jgi:hypothetical protein
MTLWSPRIFTRWEALLNEADSKNKRSHLSAAPFANKTQQPNYNTFTIPAYMLFETRTLSAERKPI